MHFIEVFATVPWALVRGMTWLLGWLGKPHCRGGLARLGGATPEEGDELADNAASEEQNGDHKNYALDHQDPLAEARKVVLHVDDDAGPDGGTKNGSHAAHQRHQHDLTRHLPGHIGQRSKLEDH